MAATYEPIATTTLSTSASTITFSSIPATYTDLKLVLVGQPTSGSFLWMRYNSDTGTNYSVTNLSGMGGSSSPSSFRTTNANQITCKGYISDSITQPAFYEIDIFNYAGSTNKTSLCVSSTDANGSGDTQRFVGLWRNTSAINTITLLRSASDTFASGTTATLYGILKA